MATVKGISLFVVTKFMVNPEGSLGSRNDGPTARFYADHILAMAPGLRDSPVDGQPTIACASRPTSWPTWVGDPERDLEAAAKAL